MIIQVRNGTLKEENMHYKEHIEQINQQIKELLGLYRDAIKQRALSESEFWVWYTLVAMEGEYTQQDICTLWSLPKQTVNTVIAHLKRKKLAYLEASPRGRNHKIVRLTPEGKRQGQTIISPITQAEQRAFEKVSTEEMGRVIGTFAKYISIMRGELFSDGTV